MALPALAAVGARLITPILARGAAAVAGRGLAATAGRMAATKVGMSMAGNLAGGASGVMGDLDSQSMETAGSLLNSDQMPGMSRSECFGLGCGSS